MDCQANTLVDFISPIGSCRISSCTPDEPVFVLSSGGSLLLLDVQNASTLGAVNTAQPPTSLCSCSHKDGNLLVVGLQRIGMSCEDSVMFFNMENGAAHAQPFHEMNLPMRITSVGISPCGQYVLILCNCRVYLWGVHNGDLVCKQELPENITDATFTADASRIVAVGSHYLAVWDIFQSQAAGQVLLAKSRFRMDPGSARCNFVGVKALHDDGSMAALDKDGKLLLFNAGRGVEKLVSTKIRNATAIAVASGRIYVAGSNGVKGFDMLTLNPICLLPPLRPHQPTAGAGQMLSRSPAAPEVQLGATALFVAAGSLICVQYADQRLVCWQEEVGGSWKILWHRQAAPGPPSAAAVCAGQSDRTGSMSLATACPEGQVQMWRYCDPTEDPVSKASLAEVPGWTAQTVCPRRAAETPRGSPLVQPPSHVPMSIAFSACGSFLAVGDGALGGVRMWDVHTLQKTAVQNPRDGKISCTTWDSTGGCAEQTLACGSTCGFVTMYGISVHGIPRLLHKVTTHRAPIMCLCFFRASNTKQTDKKLLSCDSEGHVVCTVWCATRLHDLHAFESVLCFLLTRLAQEPDHIESVG